MRVLMISGEYPPMTGGVGDFTRIVARQLVAQGCELHVLTSRTTRGEQPASDGITIWPVVGRWSLHGLGRAWKQLRRQVAFDVANIQYQAGAYGGLGAINLLPLATSLPCITTFHDLKAPKLFPKAGTWLRRRSVSLLAQRSSATIVTNLADRLALEQVGRVRLNQIPIGSNIPVHCLDSAHRAQLRTSWGASPQTTVLCYFGMLSESKGGEELIDALALLDRQALDVHLVLIGNAFGSSPEDQAYASRVKALISRHRLDSRVTYTGKLAPEQVSNALHASDICVLPYRDGVSFRRGSLMAALAHGLPIITTHPQHDTAEIADGDNMVLAPARNAVELANTIARVMASETLREHLSAGALDLAPCFGWDRIAEQTLEVYRRVVHHNQR